MFMNNLFDELIDKVEISGREYHLDLWFDTVLRFFQLMQDDSFTDTDKMWIAFDMFIDEEEHDAEIPFEIKIETLNEIISAYIINEEEGSKNSSNSNVKSSYDLQQDAIYIFSSFMQEYGIDLIEQQGKLRWEKFTALMAGLRDTTKFNEIVGIRLAKIPTGKGMEEEAKRLRELKKIYALEVPQQVQEDEMNKMFNNYFGGK